MAENLFKTSKIGVFRLGLICDSVHFEHSSTTMGSQKDAQSVASCQALFGSPILYEDPVSKAVGTEWGAHFTSTTLYISDTLCALGSKSGQTVENAN